MKIKNQTFKTLIKTNILLILLIYGDFLNPYNQTINKEFESFYNSVKVSSGRSPTKEIKYLLECKNGNLYYLGNFPEPQTSFISGEKITISKTLLFQKIKSIQNQEGHNFIVSFLYFNIILGIFSIAITFNILNIFFNNKFLDLMLVISSMPIYVSTIIYIFCY